jgi:signal transduction histidine kinase
LVTVLSTISLDNIQSYRRQKKKRITEELQVSRKKDKEISDRILEAQESERSAIGKNLHDQIGGLLAAMKIQLQTLKVKNSGDIPSRDAEKLIRMVDNCSHELYSLVDDLSAPEFEERDLSLIIQNRIELFEQSTDICFDFESTPIPIDHSRGLSIYRIICELITNSIKHSACQNIGLVMRLQNKDLSIEYNDDGIGFDIDAVHWNHGIQNVKSRIGFLNGSLNFTSKPGKTIFKISIPLI